MHPGLYAFVLNLLNYLVFAIKKSINGLIDSYLSIWLLFVIIPCHSLLTKRKSVPVSLTKSLRHAMTLFYSLSFV